MYAIQWLQAISISKFRESQATTSVNPVAVAQPCGRATHAGQSHPACSMPRADAAEALKLAVANRPLHAAKPTRPAGCWNPKGWCAARAAPPELGDVVRVLPGEAFPACSSLWAGCASPRKPSMTPVRIDDALQRISIPNVDMALVHIDDAIVCKF